MVPDASNQDHSPEPHETPLPFRLTLICPSTSTKRLKDAIKALSNEANVRVGPGLEPSTSRIILAPNAVTIHEGSIIDDEALWSLSDITAFSESSHALEFAPWLQTYLSTWDGSEEPSIRFQLYRTSECPNVPTTANPLLKTLHRHFGPSLPAGLSTDLPRWETYTDFLLFSANSFSSDSWKSLPPSTFQLLLSDIADEFSVCHIARKGSIARGDPSRRPRITPLYGEFTPNDVGEEEYEKMFWTKTKWVTPKGGIWYSWAPEFTMYSRGNGVEKSRVAMLDNVKGKTVLDMHVGIGYFTFAYFLAGAARVIACDISLQALAGLRKGADLNHISHTTLPVPVAPIDSPTNVPSTSTAKLLIYPGSNHLALPAYRKSVAHVNLGLLPTARAAYPYALEALEEEGGWLHVHEEVFVTGNQQERRKMEEDWGDGVMREIQGLAGKEVSVVGVFRVKSMGPGTMHLVVQLRVG